LVLGFGGGGGRNGMGEDMDIFNNLGDIFSSAFGGEWRMVAGGGSGHSGTKGNNSYRSKKWELTLEENYQW
jgi:DnaJ-class molecular chaperone